MKEDTILRYTDRSKGMDGITTSAWYCVKGPRKLPLFRGHCQIVLRADIEDGEIHAIQEGLSLLAANRTTNCEIILRANNQNALRALAGGPSAGREYIKPCLVSWRLSSVLL